MKGPGRLSVLVVEGNCCKHNRSSEYWVMPSECMVVNCEVWNEASVAFERCSEAQASSGFEGGVMLALHIKRRKKASW